MLNVWKDIPEFEGLYQISNTGKVWSVRAGREMKPSSGPYLHVILCNKGKQKTCRIHVLVGKAFVVGYKKGLEINHKDGDKTNNNYWNLEWVTHGQNISHKFTVLNVENKGGLPKKKINQILNGKIIATYASLHEASRLTKINVTHICKCVNGKPNHKTAGGYEWQKNM